MSKDEQTKRKKVITMKLIVTKNSIISLENVRRVGFA